jgi:hypothetical protein
MGIIDFGDKDPCLIREGSYTMGGELRPYFLGLEMHVKIAQECPFGIMLPDFDLTRHGCSFFSTRLLLTRSTIQDTGRSRYCNSIVG